VSNVINGVTLTSVLHHLPASDLNVNPDTTPGDFRDYTACHAYNTVITEINSQFNVAADAAAEAP